MNIEEMQRQAAAEITKAAAKKERFLGYCSECKWSAIGALGRKCTNPIVKVHAFNVSDAYASSRIQTCDEQRDSGSLWGKVFCGPDGLLYEPGLWARLKSWSDMLMAALKS